jgi:hypothetical protein
LEDEQSVESALTHLPSYAGSLAPDAEYQTVVKRGVMQTKEMADELWAKSKGWDVLQKVRLCFYMILCLAD